MKNWGLQRDQIRKCGKAAVNILKARSRVLNIHIKCMHVFVCVCVCVCAFMRTLGCELVVTTTLYYGCEKVIHNVVTTCPQRAPESTFLRYRNVGSQHADYKNIMCTYNVVTTWNCLQGPDRFLQLRIGRSTACNLVNMRHATKDIQLVGLTV